MRTLSVGAAFLLVIGALSGQPTSAKKGAGAAKADAPKFKAIWEPVPFNKDIELRAIACVGPESCYVAGAKGTLLFTKDGGKNWQAQLGGDPESADDRLVRLNFIDANTGWAMSENGKILGTRDGSAWVELSSVSATTKGAWFLAPLTGLELESPSSTTQSTVRRSADGGKTWAELSKCSVEATVGGLARRLDCKMNSLQFLGSNMVVAGGGFGTSDGTNVAVFAKSGDGGRTWATSIIPETKYAITDLQFWTEKDGIAVLSGGEEMYWTANGGETWTRSVKQRIWPSHAAVGGAGKIVVDVRDRGINYSFNGGRNFSSRAWSLPAPVEDVAFPDPTHGYLVGHHGMVYRYRIVPFEYTSQGMLPAMAP